MSATLASWIAALCYTASTGGIIWEIKQKAQSKKTWVMTFLTIAVLVHLFLLHDRLFTGNGLNLGFFNAGLIAAWLIGVIILIGSLNQPLEKLGLVSFPIIAVFLVFAAYGDRSASITQLTMPMKLHVITAMIAYALFAIACAQSILLAIQDRQLKRKHAGGIARALPPLHSMEQLLFKIIAMALITLTCSLVIGTIYIDDMFAQHLTHKTILSWLSWLVFAALLMGRWHYGWRGQTAMKWTVSGFVLLLLAYFGSQFVLQLVLNR